MGNPLGNRTALSNKDANTITDSGLYYVGAGNTNIANYGYLLVLKFSSASDVIQVFWKHGGGMQYRQIGGSWITL